MEEQCKIALRLRRQVGQNSKGHGFSVPMRVTLQVGRPFQEVLPYMASRSFSVILARLKLCRRVLSEVTNWEVSTALTTAQNKTYALDSIENVVHLSVKSVRISENIVVEPKRC